MAKRIPVLALILGFVALPASAFQDRRADPSRLVVMTLNAEFLWDGVEPEEGQANFAWKGSQTEAEEHMQAVAQIIIQSNPDIVNLVEVENLDALQSFNTTFLAGRGYEAYLVDGKDTYTGQDLGLLTRIDPDGALQRTDERVPISNSQTYGVSKNYYATIAAGETSFVIIGVHFLAIPTHTGRIAKRQAQAEVIRRLAAREAASCSCETIILGDFNDYDGASESLDHRDSAPITNVLERAKWMETGDSSDDLVNVAPRVPKAQRYTVWYDANDNGRVDISDMTSIDHILVSPGLDALIEHVDIPHNYDPEEVTDHFPIVVTFELDTGTAPPPPTAVVRILNLLPNPIGDDDQLEQVTLVNVGASLANLVGWKLRDLAGRTWDLDALGTLSPGDANAETIVRNGQPMALNNNGDTVELLDPDGNVVHSVTYPSVDEGEIVWPLQ